MRDTRGADRQHASAALRSVMKSGPHDSFFASGDLGSTSRQKGVIC
jgi:hypothetical protein